MDLAPEHQRLFLHTIRSLGLFGAKWRTRKAQPGPHVLRAVATDRRGATAVATRVVRVCR